MKADRFFGFLIIVIVVSFVISILRMPAEFRKGVYVEINSFEYVVQRRMEVVEDKIKSIEAYIEEAIDLGLLPSPVRLKHLREHKSTPFPRSNIY